MQFQNGIFRSYPALTILEMVIALAIITIIFAAVLPQFRAIKNGWDNRQAGAEVLQNGRVLIDHISRNLSKAVKITDVSESTETDGFIEFQDNDGNNFRYDINSTTSYAEFGLVGALSDLAGPVNDLQFTCYDACDLDTPLDITTADINDIRYVEVQTTLINSFSASQNKTFTAAAYLRTNDEVASDCNLVAWWKLNGDANDSSDNSYHGTVNGDPTWYSGGPYDGNQYLDCDGSGDYIESDYLAQSAILLPKYTISMWFRVDGGDGSTRDLFSATSDSSGNNHGILLELDSSNQLQYLHRHPFGNSGGETISTTNTYGVSTTWHHVAAVRESNTSMLLYVDGAVADSSSSTTGEFDAPVKVFLGALKPTGPPRDWDGGIDDVRIYNAALDANEIADLANILRFRDFNDAKVNSDNTSITIPTPDTNEGDLLIAAVATDGDTSASLDSNDASWNPIDVDDYGNEVTLGAWWKLAEASEPSTHQFNWTGGQQAYGWIVRFTGHHPTSPIDANSTYGESDQTPQSPAVTTTTDNCLILRLGAFDDDDVNTTPEPGDTGLSGHTDITMDESGSSVGQVVYEGFDEDKTTGGTSVTVPIPSGTSEGDLLIAAVATDGSTVGSLQPPGGEGWTQISLGVQSNAVTLGVWWKLAGASESSTHQFTWSGNEEAYGWIMRFTGHDSSGPIDTSGAQGGTSSTPTCPSVTTTVENAMIVRIGGFDDDDVTIDNTGLSGHTDITMDESGTGNSSCSGGAGYLEQPSAGASGTANFSLTGNEQYRTVTVAIAPGAGSGGTVSGGAGYIKQASSGSSGTSSFTLQTAANEARMITIAIVPSPPDTGCSAGSIYP